MRFLTPFFGWILPTRADIRAHRRTLLLVLVSALFGGLIFHQNTLGILGWIALVPLFITLHDLRGKLLFWAILTFGFIWYYLGAFWLHTLIVFHWLIPLGVVAGALYMGAYFILFAIPAAWCCRQLRPIWRPWALATCWTGVEYLRSFTDMAFPWNLLGHSQAPWNSFFMQLAAVGGVSLLSFIMALANACIAVAIVERWDKATRLPIRAIRQTVTAAVLAVAAVFLLAPPSPGKNSPIWHLDVSIVQPGVSQLQKWNAMTGEPGDTVASYQQRWLATENLMLERVATLTRAAGQDKPQLVVMPESLFMNAGFPYASQLQQQFIDLSKEVNADLFFGADNLLDRTTYDAAFAEGQRYLRQDETPEPYQIPELPTAYLDDGTTSLDTRAFSRMIPTVAAWHISRTDGLQPRVYNKMQLVPFGEQVPFIQGVEWLQQKFELAGIAGAYRPGLRNTIFEVERAPDTNQPAAPLRFGTVICFESTFSHLTRHLALAKVHFLTVLTNDSWYDPNYAISQGGFWGTLFRIPGIKQLASAGPRQHLVQSQFRAVETGRPIVRSANTGISAFIDGRGTIIKELGYGESDFISAQLSHSDATNPKKPNFFLRYGEWLGRLCLGIWAAIICLIILTRPKTSGKRFALHK